jgi:hypothetical protein
MYCRIPAALSDHTVNAYPDGQHRPIDVQSGTHRGQGWHLLLPAFDDGIILKEKDGSVAWSIGAVDLVLPERLLVGYILVSRRLGVTDNEEEIDSPSPPRVFLYVSVTTSQSFW